MDISRRQDDGGLRWYTDGEVEVLSVTTVLGFLEEDTDGLDYWKSQHQGEGDEFHHEHIYWYSAPRGTLCHYQALCKFEDAFDGDDEMWGDEEADSMAQVMEGPHPSEFDDASHHLEDITYSILKNQGVVSTREEYETLFAGSTRLVDVLHEDIEYFVEAFERICEELGVNDDSVLRVEKYLVNGDDGYGGQCDLCYEDPHGNVVVADLKTSSGLRQKHRLQSVAYMKAVEKAEWGPEEVDRVEVWRIDPDAEEWQVHSHEVPPHADHLHDEERSESSSYTDAYWFEDKWGDFEYESIEEMWETFKELTDVAHEAAA